MNHINKLSSTHQQIFLFISVLIFNSSVLSIQAFAQTNSAQTPQTQAVDRPNNKKQIKAAKAKKPKALQAKPASAKVSSAVGKISELKVSGNKKIEKDAILARLESKVGDDYSDETIKKDIASIFKLGFFYNIEVEQTVNSGQIVLEYKVQEKPSIAELKFEGVSDLKSEDVSEASGMKAYELLNISKIKEAQEKVLKLYEDKGFFLARVDFRVEDMVKDESVRVIFNIQENDKVKVKHINILGNKHVKDSEIKGRLVTQEEGFFTGLSGSGAFKQDAFDRDVQIVRFMYYNKGYIQAKVDRPQVTVTPDKKGIYITLKVEEGEQFDVGDIDFAGDVLFPKTELFEAIKLDDNQIFAYDVLQKDLSDLQAKYGDLGYAYTNVVPRWNIREKDRKVDLVFDFDKGIKVYFGEINVVGNSKTRDKVVRRELKIKEGELYNETRRRESAENIQRLGFFEEVNFKTSTPPDRPEIMNIDIVVKERSTGQIQFGAGYGSAQGFTLSGSVQQTNFQGKGQNLGVSLDYSSSRRSYDVSFTEPYFRDSLWSVGFRVFETNVSGRDDYDERKYGPSLFLGHPLGEYTRFNMSYAYVATRLGKKFDSFGLVTDPVLYPLSTAEGDAGLAGVSLDYDTRNDRLRPTKGIYASTGLSVTGPFGGNLKYYKANATFRYFKNIFWDVVFRNSFSYGRIESIDRSQSPPFNELYLLGGPYSLRGYRYGRVGRMVQSDFLKTRLKQAIPTITEADAEQRSRTFYGGTHQLMYQGELLFPMIREAEMYGVGFYDVGQAEDSISDSRLFANAGFGVRWFSPIGPLRFEWGFPLNRDTVYHEASVFEFSIGTPF